MCKVIVRLLMWYGKRTSLQEGFQSCMHPLFVSVPAAAPSLSSAAPIFYLYITGAAYKLHNKYQIVLFLCSIREFLRNGDTIKPSKPPAQNNSFICSSYLLNEQDCYYCAKNLFSSFISPPRASHLCYFTTVWILVGLGTSWKTLVEVAKIAREIWYYHTKFWELRLKYRF